MYQILPSTHPHIPHTPSPSTYISVSSITPGQTQKPKQTGPKLPPPSPFYCVCCSGPFSLVPGTGFGEDPVQEIHLYTQDNEFDRRVTILEALDQVFGPGDNELEELPIVSAVSESHVLALCPKCANIVSGLYRDFIGLLHCSDGSGYLAKLLPQIQAWHEEQKETQRLVEQVQVQDFNDELFTEDLTRNSESDVESEGQTSKVFQSPKSKISSLRSKYLGKDKPKKKRVRGPRKPKDNKDGTKSRSSKIKKQKEENSENPSPPRLKPRGKRYVCRNIKKRNYFYCPLCPHRELYNWRLHHHIMSLHNQIPEDGSCPCGWTYYSALLRPDTHTCLFEPVTGGPIFCDVCGQVFGTDFKLQFHMEREHVVDDVRFSCVSCPKITKSRNKLYAHQEIHSAVKKYLCPMCGISFSQKRGLDRHQAIHTRDPVFCEVCGKSFRNEVNLAGHKASAHGEEKGELKVNANGNEEERAFQCDSCPKSFKASKHLIEHKSHVHSPIPGLNKRHRCTHCSKSYWRNSQLVKHFRQHVEPKSSHTCPICNISRISQKSLNKHLTFKHVPDFTCMVREPPPRKISKRKAKKIEKIIKNEIKIELKKVDLLTPEELAKEASEDIKRTPWKCETCGKFYSARKNLVEHQLIHSGQHLKEICSICKKKFRTITHLIKHLKSHDTNKSRELAEEIQKNRKKRKRKDKKIDESEQSEGEEVIVSEDLVFDVKPDITQLQIPVEESGTEKKRRSSGRVANKKKL